MKNNNNGKKLNVLIVGAGMYVSGRGTSGYGTVLPALSELCREGIVDSICVAATSSKSIRDLKNRAGSLSKLTGTSMKIIGLPSSGKNPLAYKQAMASFKPDCAIAVVPDQRHYKIVSDLLNSAVHTLVVKPLTPTLQQAKKLAQLAERKKVYAAVEFHKRYDEANLKLKDVVSSGKIGELLYINVEYSQRRIIPLKTFRVWINGTNIFQYLGVHYVDIIYFATGASPQRVLAVGQKKLLKKSGIDNYDSIQAVIEWVDSRGSKFISTILTNWVDPNTTSAMSDQKIKVIGTMGRIESDQKNRGVQIVTENSGIEDINPYFTQSYPVCGEKTKTYKGYGIESVKQFCRDVLNIKQGLNIPADFNRKRPVFRDALVSTAVVEAVNKSLRKNSCWVAVKI